LGESPFRRRDAISSSLGSRRGHGAWARGRSVLLSLKDGTWRFEEEETSNWHRTPEGRQRYCH